MNHRLFILVPAIGMFAGMIHGAEPSRVKINATKAGCLQELGRALDVCAMKPENEQSACDAAAGIAYRQCVKNSPPPPPKEQECLKIEQTEDLACAKKPVQLQQECFATAQRNFRACLNSTQ